jgi:hypothetical protein
VNKYIIKIVLFYTVSHIGVLALYDAVYWDDWTLHNSDYESIYETFKQVGAPWIGPFHVFLLKLPFDGYKLFTFVSYLITYLCFYLILLDTKILNITNKEAYFITIISLVLPFNMAKIAMIDFPYAICLMLFFMAWYKMKTNRLISCILFFLSFSTQSLLVFYIFPVIWLFFGENNNMNYQKIKSFIFKNWLLLVLPVLFFFIKIKFFQPYGNYEGYNSNFRVKYISSGYVQIFKNLFSFIRSEKTILFASVSVAVIALLISNKIFESFTRRKSFVLMGIILLSLGVFPYLILKLNPTFYEWSSRHQLLMPFGAGLLIFGLLSCLQKRFQLFAVFSVVTFSMLYTNITYHALYLDWQLQKSVIKEIKAFKTDNKLDFPVNSLFLVDDKQFCYALKRTPRFYEYNGWLKAALAREHNFALNINDLESFNNADYDAYFNEMYNCGGFERSKDNNRFLIKINNKGLVSIREFNENI